MSLPFLDKKRIASTIMERRNQDGTRGSSAEVATEDDQPDQLSNLSGDLLAAIEQKSPSGIASAFKAMFEHCESEPHDEYEGDDDSDGSDHDLFEAKG